MKLKLEVEIPEGLIELVVRGIMDNFPEASATLRCYEWDYEQCHFRFEDGETGKIYDVDKPTLMAAFPLLFTDKWPKGCTQPPFSADVMAWDNWTCQCDATDFDAFVQLACFGEVIYG